MVINQLLKKIPEGYKQTEAGVIPEDWSSVRLGSLAYIQRGASPRPIDSPIWFDQNSKTGWLRISDVSKAKKYLLETTQNLSLLGIKNSRPVDKGSLIMSICATVGKPILTAKDVCIHDGFVVFNNPKVNKNFLYYILLKLEKSWEKQGQTGSQMNLNTNLINLTHVAIPSLDIEQDAITRSLSDIDDLIITLEKLIVKKRDIKTATMQQLLTGKKRLPPFDKLNLKDCKPVYKPTELGEIPEDWSVVELGDIAKINMGQSPNGRFYNNEGDGLPLVQGNTDIKNRKTIIRNYTSQTTKFAQKGEIILSVRAPVGEIAIATFDCCIGRGVCSIKYGNNFLYHLLVFYEDQWHKLSKGSTFDSVNADEVRTLLLPLPNDFDEQIAIAQALTDFDKEIYLLEHRLNKTKQIKQGMMEELLMGRIRLI